MDFNKSLNGKCLQWDSVKLFSMVRNIVKSMDSIDVVEPGVVLAAFIMQVMSVLGVLRTDCIRTLRKEKELT